MRWSTRCHPMAAGLPMRARWSRISGGCARFWNRAGGRIRLRPCFLRAGLSWPRGRLTDADMAAARDKLDREAFDRAWLSGEQLSSGDAVALMR